jgi:poly-gamma-glutamate capsule biosynthesis protein CapA/YwtB (metallophosphatase superfamily)
MNKFIWFVIPFALASILMPVLLISKINDPIKQHSINNQKQNSIINFFPTTDSKISFLAVGDISLSRNVAAQILKYNNPLLPFKNTANLLKSTDFNFANLESPFSGGNYFGKTGSLVFNAPLNNIKGLMEYNFKILNLANNHALDQGLKGLEYTRNYLIKNNIQFVGAGNNLTEAWQPALIEINGIKIAFIGASYSSINDNAKTTNDYVARIEDLNMLKNAITQAQKTSDFIVVAMHAGTEYTYKPNEKQINFAHAAIEAGADMVIGHHPHWIQSIEQYQGKYIFYSLGNFIFDQMWSQETKEGLMLKITLKKNSKSELYQIELLPIIIENYSTPRLANELESATILNHIGIKEKILFSNY